MSSRTSYALAVLMLLVAAAFRLWDAMTLPPGFNPDEINDIRITETVRQGRVEVFYDLGGEGREGLYQTMMSVATAAVGGGTLGYRMVSFWAGLISLALVYALVKRLYTPLAALAAMSLLAVSLWPILLSRTISRESLLPILVAGVLLALARAFRIPARPPSHPSYHRPSTAPFTMLALLLSVGFYIHPAGFIIALMAMFLILYAILSRQQVTRRVISYIGFSIVVMSVLSMPYLLSSIRLRELAGTDRLLEGFADIHPTPVQALGNSLAGFFLIGDQNPIHNLPGRPLIDLISGVFLILGLITCIRFAGRRRFAMPVIATVILIPVALLPATSPNFPSMTVLLPLVALFFGVGVSSLYNSLRGDQHRFARPLFAVALLALLVFNIVWTARDLFIGWPNLREVQTAYNGRMNQLAHYLDRTAGDTPSVVCVTSLNTFESANLEPYEIVSLMMHRQTVPIRYADCGSSLILAEGGAREQVVLLEEDRLLSLHSEVRNWLEDGELVDEPGVPPQSVVILDVAERLANTVGRFTTTEPIMYPPEAPGDTPLTYPPVRLGGNLSFLGYKPYAEETYRPGDYVTVITYWRVDGYLPRDLRLFTHVLLDPFSIATQSDMISVLASQLQPRDVFIQITFVQLPRVLTPGTYGISIGAYEDNTDTPLNVFEFDSPRGNRLMLDDITVEAR